MKNRLLLSAAALALLTAAVPLLAERTDEGTVEIGGSLYYDNETPAGGSFQIDLLGGYTVSDGWLVGGDVRFDTDDNADFYALFVNVERSFEIGSADTVSPVVPYCGVGLGYASADFDGEDGDASGIVLGLRAGLKLMLTGDLAVDFSLHGDLSTDDVFRGDDGPSSTDFSIRVGLRTFLF
jgi:opacity protein-like surface antigen